jgi:hypothetical protein
LNKQKIKLPKYNFEDLISGRGFPRKLRDQVVFKNHKYAYQKELYTIAVQCKDLNLPQQSIINKLAKDGAKFLKKEEQSKGYHAQHGPMVSSKFKNAWKEQNINVEYIQISNENLDAFGSMEHRANRVGNLVVCVDWILGIISFSCAKVKSNGIVFNCCNHVKNASINVHKLPKCLYNYNEIGDAMNGAKDISLLEQLKNDVTSAVW